MKYTPKNKGFTLIEMLVVIAIIAVLVSIIIPTISNATSKAKAGVDAANMRGVLGALNVLVIDHNNELSNADLDGMTIPPCKTFPGAIFKVEYCQSHYIRIYYVLDDNYYGLDYFVAIAENGKPDESVSTEEPATEAGVTWFTPVISTGN